MVEEILLEIQGLKKSYGRNEVLRGLDLRVPRGAIYGLVGLNGAGKTTTIECALGLQRPNGGTISILGKPARRIHETRGRVGVALDTPALHPGLTVREELRNGWIFAGPEGRRPEEAMALLGVEGLRGVKTRKLSLGNRRRTSLALALLGKPEVVILDEPFSGLDASGVEDFISLILGLREGSATTFLISSHELGLVERISTHLGILHGGRLAQEGPIREILDPLKRRLRIECDATGKAIEILRAWKPPLSISQEGSGAIEVDLGGESPAELNAGLVRAGVGVYELHLEKSSLVGLFRRLTRDAGSTDQEGLE